MLLRKFKSFTMEGVRAAPLKSIEDSVCEANEYERAEYKRNSRIILLPPASELRRAIR